MHDYSASELSQELRGQEIVLESGDGEVYSGVVDHVNSQLRRYELEGFKGVTIGPGWIADPLEQDFELSAFNVWDLEKPFYCTRDYLENEGIEHYINRVSSQERLDSLPVVRENQNGGEIVDGNRGITVCREAGVEEQVCIVDNMNEIEAAEYFIEDHLPHPGVEKPGSPNNNFYDDASARNAVEEILEHFGTERALQFDRMEYNMNRLGIPDPETAEERGKLSG